MLLVGTAAIAGQPATAGSAAAGAAAGGAAVLAAGAVASPDRYGALAAREILKAGGNAADAAVATGFALAVTYPEAGNLGGGGFMTLYMHGKPYFLDYREIAPAGASAGMYLDASGEPVAALSLVGNLSSGVPGTVRGLAEAHRRFGRLSWRRDLAPAIRFATRGFLVTSQLIGMRDDSQAPFLDTTNFEHYFAGMAAGQRFRQPELAATLRRIAARGDREFYEGRTADLLLAQMHRGAVAGLIDRTDLARYQAVWREPVEGTWHGYTLVTAPPPSSGGIALLQMLTMKQDAAALFQGVALNSPQYLHLVSEIEKRVFADRAQYLGDPDFVQVPVRQLIDPAYLGARAAQIDPLHPSPLASVTPGLQAMATEAVMPGAVTLGETRVELAALPVNQAGFVIECVETYDPPTTTLDENGQGEPYAVFGSGAHLAEIEVDVELGRVRVTRLTCAHDVGRAINPTLVEGQIEGGAAQGLGLALMEEFVPHRSENLHDYLIPTIGDMPPVDCILIEDPSSEGPFGAKGIGEQALIPTAPAIFNAIHHATGVRLSRAPATPDRLLAALEALKR